MGKRSLNAPKKEMENMDKFEEMMQTVKKMSPGRNDKRTGEI